VQKQKKIKKKKIIEKKFKTKISHDPQELEGELLDFFLPSCGRTIGKQRWWFSS